MSPNASEGGAADSEADRRLRVLLDQAAKFDLPAERTLTALAIKRVRGRSIAVANVNEVLEALRLAFVGIVDLLSRGGSSEGRSASILNRKDKPDG